MLNLDLILQFEQNHEVLKRRDKFFLAGIFPFKKGVVKKLKTADDINVDVVYIEHLVELNEKLDSPKSLRDVSTNLIIRADDFENAKKQLNYFKTAELIEVK